jgi:RNA polymerase sigma factor (sigma-70 family)
MKPDDQTPPHEWSVADLGAFYVENRPQFLAHAKRITSTSVEAEEIVQDALVRVLLASPELASHDHALAYFHRVIENLTIDLYRREGRQPRLIVLDDAAIEIEASWNPLPDHADLIAAADDAAIVREAISLLSPAERAALVMWEFEGRSAADIAQELGIKESAVRHTLSRARSGLRRILAERIIDEKRGLTALDLLSVAYRKVERHAQKTSKVALSILVLIAAFVGFGSNVQGDSARNNPLSIVTQESSEDSLETSSSQQGSSDSSTDEPKSDRTRESLPSAKTKTSLQSFSVEASSSDFAGLDIDGVPSGFTVADSLGSTGSLFSGQQNSILTETGWLLSNIVSTRSGSTNVLINQSIILDSFGTSYVAEVSVGINGGWQPLRLSYVSSDTERLASGNYLLTAVMMVDSAVRTTVKVPTGAFGTDLSSAPNAIVTKLLLDTSKTRILAQAVLVSGDSQGDGA